jgi:hypothetical protein
MPLFRLSFAPPRNPLLRAALAVGGLVFLGFFAAFGLLIAAGVLAVIGVRRLMRSTLATHTPFPPAAPRNTDPNVIEGEYSVVRKPHASLFPR